MTEHKRDLTRMLETWEKGDQRVRERVMEEVIEELRVIARYHLRKERGDHTLRTDCLVNEMYLRLQGGKTISFKDRAHFFGIASNAMRQILVDYAREQATEKRGGRFDRVFVDNLDILPPDEKHDLLILDQALKDLSAYDPEKAKLVVMRYFGGMTIEEVADALDSSPASVKRDWNIARAHLLKKMKGNPQYATS